MVEPEPVVGPIDGPDERRDRRDLVLHRRAVPQVLQLDRRVVVPAVGPPGAVHHARVELRRVALQGHDPAPGPPEARPADGAVGKAEEAEVLADHARERLAVLGDVVLVLVGVLNPHEDRLAGVGLQEVGDGAQDVVDVVPGRGVAVSDAPVPPQPDIDEAHAAVQLLDQGQALGRGVPVAAVGHGVVRSGHCEAIERDIVVDAGHPVGRRAALRNLGGALRAVGVLHLKTTSLS
jgi:hypothetical protein